VHRQLMGFRNLTDLAEGLVGLHAARQSGPYVSAYARLGTYGLAEHTRHPDDGGLVHIRCMRGTIHALPVGLASLAHAATAKRLKRASCRRLYKLGLSRRDVAATRDRVLDSVRESHASLPGGPDGSAPRAVLRHLWDTGEVLAFDASGTPHHKRRQFTESRNTPGWRDWAEDEAGRELAFRYLRTYGPAAPEDLAWWTGWGMRRTQQILDQLRPDLIDVHVAGLPPLVLASADEASLRSCVESAVPVRTVAYEDPSIKAYFVSRERYLRGVSATRLFWYAGEALASVLLDGVVAATWRWDTATRCVSWVPVRPLDGAAARAIRLQLREIAQWLSAISAPVGSST
jgi:hypothetical protein